MSYHVVTVFNLPATLSSTLEGLAMGRFNCSGIEEYALDEAQVDALLGERSYSGGDLPLEVLAEVDEAMHRAAGSYRYFFPEEQLAHAQAFLSLIAGHYLCEAQLDTLADEDWNAQWKKHYKPIEVDAQLVVLPEWEDARLRREPHVLRIHPGMGFGTGSHETTFLCLREFLRLPLPFSQAERVLDYGSGSGILGLAALLVAPSWQADMVDIDAQAHRNCRQNMELNHIASARVRLLMVEERPTAGNYPLVFANILQNILFAERDYLIGQTRAGGFLLLSGLLKGQLDETAAHYDASGLVSLKERVEKGDWGALILRKKP